MLFPKSLIEVNPIPKFCPECGEEVSGDALFCPECGARITRAAARAPPRERPAAEEKRGQRIAGGVLTIIAACLLFIVGIIGIWSYYGGWATLVGLLGLLGFAFGLAGGILTLTRKVFALAIIGVVLVMVVGILSCIPISYTSSYYSYYSGYSYYTSYLYLWPLGFPIFLFSLLGVIFTAVAKQDFR